MSAPLRVLLVSTPVGPLGSGLGGGVELTVVNLARVLTSLGHVVAIVTPEPSQIEAVGLKNRGETRTIEVIQIPGSWQITAQTQQRSAPVVVGSALANMWQYARQHQTHYDLLVNFAYDWLPFYLTSFLSVPVAHFVSMGSLSDALDNAIAQVSAQFPGTLGAYTQSQIDTFSHLTPPPQWQILSCGIDLAKYDYCPQPDRSLAWVGRISAEKGLEDAITATAKANYPLKVYGKLEDTAYWQDLQPLIADLSANVAYGGFLPTDQLQRALGQAQALLITPHWVEAFGIVAIEALACGVPVIAYRQGGPAEIVRSGETGWLVTPGSVAELVTAIANINRINRHRCRLQAEADYSLLAWGKRFEQWFNKIVRQASES